MRFPSERGELVFYFLLVLKLIDRLAQKNIVPTMDFEKFPSPSNFVGFSWSGVEDFNFGTGLAEGVGKPFAGEGVSVG